MTTSDNEMIYALNSLLTERLRASGQHGQQFGGDRDLYAALGYRRTLTAQDYLDAYRRGSLAGRGVAIHTEDTWKRKAIVIDGDSRSDQQQPASEFVRQWQQLANRQQVWHRLRRVDLLGRLGRYAVLLLGARDQRQLAQPLAGNLGGPDGLLYVRPYHETQAAIGDIERDAASPRYGKPLTYTIKSDDLASQTVHYSRVLHVAEDLLADDVYGVPALESVYNRLDDLEKVVGGSSEAFWLNIRRGLAFLAREGVDLSTDAEARSAMREQIDDFVHNLSRVMRLSGVDIQDLGADVVSGYEQFKVLVSVIAADLDVPQRKLIGNEQGERASSQDERNWAAKIRSRQTDYAEPLILRALIDWCVRNGALSPPASGSYDIEWPPVYEPTAQEEADTALTVAQALATVTGGAPDYAMPTEAFTERYLHYVPEELPAAVIARERRGEAE